MCWKLEIFAVILVLLVVTPHTIHSFPIGQIARFHHDHHHPGFRLTSTGSDVPSETTNDNKAMAFLRKIGKVGGTTDFKNAIGVDEGTAGKAAGKWGQGKVNECENWMA